MEPANASTAVRARAINARSPALRTAIAARSADMQHKVAGEKARSQAPSRLHLGGRDGDDAEIRGRLVEIELVFADELLELVAALNAGVSAS